MDATDLSLRLAPRRDVLAATVRPDEREAVVQAIQQYGWRKPSVGCRIVLMAFARSAEVRDAVWAWFEHHRDDVT